LFVNGLDFIVYAFLPKVVNFFRKISDQRERAFCSERQLELAGGPAALYALLPKDASRSMRTQIELGAQK
jgi:hypothetical protein